MLFIRKFDNSAGYHDEKFNLPYPYLVKTKEDEKVYFGEVFNIVIVYYNIPTAGTYSILGEDFPLWDIQEIYVDDGDRELPVREYYFSEAKTYEIKFIMTRRTMSLKRMLYNLSYVSKINLNKANNNYSPVVTISEMFKGCSSLTSINLSKLDTTKTSDITGLFENCKSLSQVTMNYPVDKIIYLDNAFSGVAEEGIFYYNPEYDYTKIIDILPPGWVAKELVSCYAAGYWINEQPWTNDYVWVNS